MMRMIFILLFFTVSSFCSAKSHDINTCNKEIISAKNAISENAHILLGVVQNANSTLAEKVRALRMLSDIQSNDLIPVFLLNIKIRDTNFKTRNEIDVKADYPCVAGLANIGFAALPQIIECYCNSEDIIVKNLLISAIFCGKMENTAVIYLAGLEKSASAKKNVDDIREMITILK